MNAGDEREDDATNTIDERAHAPTSPGTVRMSPLGAVLVRTAACVYDLMLLVAVLFVVTAILLVANDGEAYGPLYLIVVFVIGWLFFDGFWRHGGQTLGMRAWRLQLIGDGDVPLTRGRTLSRYALGCLLFGVTYVTVPFDERRRALHDRLTRTRLVRLAKEKRGR